jgi:alpha-tubulin suppressor-like RCC1 family protein
VWCWGDDADGQLGNGGATDSPTPVRASSITGVTAIAAGGGHTCALTSAGGVECWGFNSYGQVGDGTTTNRASPVPVSGLASGVTAIAAGNNHTCALTASGTVQCWGFGFYGQLGNASIASSSVPVAVTALPSAATAIATGGTHSCALIPSGASTANNASSAIWCWGDDQSGQLGDNQNVDSLVPVEVVSLGSGAAAITAGTAHTCALFAGGGAQCWGWNVSGQLGCDTNQDTLAPVSVCGL